MISDIMRTAVNMGIGAFFMTKENVEELINMMVQNGELKKDEAKKLMYEIRNKILSSQKGIESRIEEIVEKSLHRLNIPGNTKEA
jgi:polyhydroxyalkanoate synthesis regulator phasin